MSTLRELSDQELVLCQHVAILRGSTENKSEPLGLSDIGAKYLQIHREYLRLVANVDDAVTQLEALKRLMFLSWYGDEMVEPDFFSGLNYVDDDLVQASYELLNRSLAANAIDPELHWMLSYYSSWHDFIPAFTNPNLPHLAAFIAAVDHTVLHIPLGQLPMHAMRHRGQMGLYFWKSVRVENDTKPCASP